MTTWAETGALFSAARALAHPTRIRDVKILRSSNSKACVF